MKLKIPFATIVASLVLPLVSCDISTLDTSPPAIATDVRLYTAGVDGQGNITTVNTTPDRGQVGERIMAVVAAGGETSDFSYRWERRLPNGTVSRLPYVTSQAFDLQNSLHGSDIRVIVRQANRSGERASRWLPIAGSSGQAPYLVTFDSGGGTPIYWQWVESGGKVIPPTPPTRSLPHSRFCGWFTDEHLTTRWDFTTDFVLGSQVLYARWHTRFLIGERGPAGGVIFFVADGTVTPGISIASDSATGSYATAFFLEAAPTVLGTPFAATPFMWDTLAVTPISTQEGLGYGFRNTRRILDRLGITRAPAANEAAAFLTNSADGSKRFNDWFLPSVDELAELSTVINNPLAIPAANAIARLTNDLPVWTSTQSSATDAIVMLVLSSSTPGAIGYQEKSNAHYVIPIRAFPNHLHPSVAPIAQCGTAGNPCPDPP